MFILRWLAIHYLMLDMKLRKITNIEYVIRNDGYTMYKRNFTKEKSIKETISKIK